MRQARGMCTSSPTHQGHIGKWIPFYKNLLGTYSVLILGNLDISMKKETKKRQISLPSWSFSSSKRICYICKDFLLLISWLVGWLVGWILITAPLFTSFLWNRHPHSWWEWTLEMWITTCTKSIDDVYTLWLGSFISILQFKKKKN